MRILVATLLFSLLFSDMSLSGDKKNLSIELQTSSQEEVDTLSATAFGISLAGAVQKKGGVAAIPNGIYRPTFEILVYAFSSQIQIWRELIEKEDPGSLYMNQLVAVDNSGFLREYVWANHSTAIVGDDPIRLRVSEFEAWSRDNLTEHVARIEARLIVNE